MMEINEYQRLAMRSAKKLPTIIENLNHAALGATSECGELATTVKASIIYGKPIDLLNIEEEIGDALWFLALAADTIGLELSFVAKKNIEKLRKRYPEKYTDQAAQARADKV